MLPDYLLQVLPIQVVLGSKVAEDDSRLREHHSINFSHRHLAEKQASICGLSKVRLGYCPSMVQVSL